MQRFPSLCTYLSEQSLLSISPFPERLEEREWSSGKLSGKEDSLAYLFSISSLRSRESDLATFGSMIKQ